MLDKKLLNIDKIEKRIKSTLHRDLRTSYRAIMDLANMLKPESELINDTVILGSRVESFFSDQYDVDNESTEKEKLVSESIQILDKIIKELRLYEQEDWSTLNSMRSFYIDQSRVRERCVSIKSLHKRYDRSGFELQDINFELNSGEILGVLGANGNGKSTLLKLIAGELKKDSGVIHYPFLPTGTDDWSIFKQQIAYIPQKLNDWGFLDTLKNQLHFCASIKGIYGSENDRVVNYYIQRLNLDQYKDLKWNELSGGFQLRFELAKALLSHPKLIIMDEPLANLDVKAQSILLSDLRRIANSLRFKTSIIISSQNLHEVEKISDKVLFLKEGYTLYNGNVNNIQDVVKFNCYQLDTDISYSYVIKKLSKISNIRRIEDEGPYLMIYTGKEYKGKQLQEVLIKLDIPYKFFRDISNSTRILFE